MKNGVLTGQPPHGLRPIQIELNEKKSERFESEKMRSWLLWIGGSGRIEQLTSIDTIHRFIFHILVLPPLSAVASGERESSSSIIRNSSAYAVKLRKAKKVGTFLPSVLSGEKSNPKRIEFTCALYYWLISLFTAASRGLSADFVLALFFH